MRTTTRAGVIVPSPASRKINLESHVATETSARHASCRYALCLPDDSCFVHVRPQLSAICADGFRARLISRDINSAARLAISWRSSRTCLPLTSRYKLNRRSSAREFACDALGDSDRTTRLSVRGNAAVRTTRVPAMAQRHNRPRYIDHSRTATAAPSICICRELNRRSVGALRKPISDATDRPHG